MVHSLLLGLACLAQSSPVERAILVVDGESVDKSLFRASTTEMARLTSQNKVRVVRLAEDFEIVVALPSRWLASYQAQADFFRALSDGGSPHRPQVLSKLPGDLADRFRQSILTFHPNLELGADPLVQRQISAGAGVIVNGRQMGIKVHPRDHEGKPLFTFSQELMGNPVGFARQRRSSTGPPPESGQRLEVRLELPSRNLEKRASQIRLATEWYEKEMRAAQVEVAQQRKTALGKLLHPDDRWMATAQSLKDAPPEALAAMANEFAQNYAAYGFASKGEALDAFNSADLGEISMPIMIAVGTPNGIVAIEVGG